MGHDSSLGRVIIITGLSGSGKSTALNALEDNGFFCMDNLPGMLLTKFLATRHESGPETIKLGVVMDLRAKEFVHGFPDIFAQIQAQNYDLQVVFLEASDDVLVKRFSQTRRRHPLAGDGNLMDGITRERTLMEPIREAAHEVIDTTNFTGHKLRDIIIQKYCQIEAGKGMAVELLSFGFKNGLPSEADIIMDVRFLPNPFYIDELRELDGRNNQIVEYVMASEDSLIFLTKFVDLLEFVVPLYRREGKSYLTIAVGCTGGQHRSVTVVNELAQRLTGTIGHVSVRHRDIIRRRDN
ncbi:MAG: RNase adapter RapZ [Deltaproteobacteria bacterium]|nr:RNase adapter RapZ [Deltaproteobacteria bacterium]